MLIPYKIKLDEETVNLNRNNNLPIVREPWNEYFVLQAYLVSTRSLDSRTRHGCIIVDKNNRIISTGYNSFIRNINDKCLSNIAPHKYKFMIHSEHNALLSAASRSVSCNGCYAYITGKPCISCLQYMYQAGITKIYYPDRNLAKMCDNEEELKNFDLLYNLMSHDLEINIVESENLTKKINAILEAFPLTIAAESV